MLYSPSHWYLKHRLKLRAMALVVAMVTLRAAIHYRYAIEAQKLGNLMVDGLRARCLRLLLGAEWRVLATMRQSDNASLLISNVDRVEGASKMAVVQTMVETAMVSTITMPVAADRPPTNAALVWALPAWAMPWPCCACWPASTTSRPSLPPWRTNWASPPARPSLTPTCCGRPSTWVSNPRSRAPARIA